MKSSAIPSGTSDPFDALIAQTGLRLNHIARQLGIERTVFYRKRQQPERWTVDEIHRLARILHLSPNQVFVALSEQVRIQEKEDSD